MDENTIDYFIRTVIFKIGISWSGIKPQDTIAVLPSIAKLSALTAIHLYGEHIEEISAILNEAALSMGIAEVAELSRRLPEISSALREIIVTAINCLPITESDVFFPEGKLFTLGLRILIKVAREAAKVSGISDNTAYAYILGTWSSHSTEDIGTLAKQLADFFLNARNKKLEAHQILRQNMEKAEWMDFGGAFVRTTKIGATFLNYELSLPTMDCEKIWTETDPLLHFKFKRDNTLERIATLLNTPLATCYAGQIWFLASESIQACEWITEYLTNGNISNRLTIDSSIKLEHGKVLQTQGAVEYQQKLKRYIQRIQDDLLRKINESHGR